MPQDIVDDWERRVLARERLLAEAQRYCAQTPYPNILLEVARLEEVARAIEARGKKP